MATKKNMAVKHGDKEYNYYRTTKTIGHKYENGEKIAIRKQFYGTSKLNAEKKYEEWKKARENENQSLTETLRTFGELADFYNTNVLAVSAEYARSTIDRYSGAYESFKKNDSTGLLNLNIRKVSASDIQIAYNNFDVHRSTVETLNKFFGGFFKWAMLNKYCDNPLSAVTIPVKPFEKKKDGIVIWTDDEVETIKRSIYDYHHRFLVLVALYTGMRISELFGLKYDDISDNIIHVRRQYHRGYLTEPKYKSFRDIPLHPVLADELKLHKERHLKEMQLYNYKTDYIFTTNQGGMLDYTNVKRSLQRFYRRIGITPKSPHTYRATFCTNLCRANVPIQTAAALMGHKSVEITARFYALVSQTDKIDAINLLKS